MPRVERYKNILKMTRRVFELKDVHDWTQKQLFKATRLMDDTNPYDLHLLGEIKWGHAALI